MLDLLVTFREIMEKIIPLWYIQCAGFLIVVYQQIEAYLRFHPLREYYKRLYLEAGTSNKDKPVKKGIRIPESLEGVGEIFLGITEAFMIWSYEKYDPVAFCLGFLVSYLYKIPLVKLNAKYGDYHPNRKRAGIIRTVINLIPVITAVISAVIMEK